MNRIWTAFGSGLAVVAMASVAAGQTVDFNDAVDLAVGDQPDATAIGDFDGDGFNDLAVTTDNPDKVSILFNQGDGKFGAPVNVNLPNSSSPGAVIAVDVDGDDDPDLVVALKDFDEVMVVTNSGGTLTPGASYDVGDRPVDIRAGQLNGDDSPDLAVSNRDGNSVSILLNDGNGAFGTAQTIAAGTEPRELALGDLDDDGDLDVAVAAHDSRTVEILLNDGSGVFSDGPTLSVGSTRRAEGLASADLNGDGRDDLAAATEDNGNGSASIFLQGAGGTFSGPTHFPTGGLEPSSAVAADFDLDGDVDLAIANQDSNDVSTLENNGNGTFQTAVLYDVGLTPERLVGGDLDGNGSIDLVSTNRDDDTLSVLINVNADGWSDLGFALAGTNGDARLEGFGTLRANTPASLVITNGLPNATAFLIIGLDRIDIAFKGGTFVPSVDVVLPFTLDASGNATLTGTWPSGITAGEDFFFQVWFVDAGAVRGLAATNAVRAVAQ